MLLYLRGRGVLEKAETITSLCPPDVRPQFAPDAKPINILCIDGGGIRGRNLMVMVEELEKALGRPLADEFDLVAGSSIGGCGALFLQRYGAKATTMARQAMSQLQSRCFAQRSKARLLSLGHYCQDARREFMLELCGREPLRNPAAPQRGPRAFALSSRMGGGGSLEPFLFRSYARAPNSLPGTSRADLSRAVEATSAAPLMFPRTRLRNGQHLTDGGLIANDPTAIALQERRRSGQTAPSASCSPSALARCAAAAAPRSRSDSRRSRRPSARAAAGAPATARTFGCSRSSTRASR